MFLSTNRPESIGSRLLTSFSSAKVTVPPYVGLLAAGGGNDREPREKCQEIASGTHRYPPPEPTGFQGGYVRPLPLVQSAMCLRRQIRELPRRRAPPGPVRRLFFRIPE